MYVFLYIFREISSSLWLFQRVAMLVRLHYKKIVGYIRKKLNGNAFKMVQICNYFTRNARQGIQ